MAKAEQYSYAAKQELKKVRRALWEDLQFAGASTSFDEDVNAAQYLDELAEKAGNLAFTGTKCASWNFCEKRLTSPHRFHDHELDTTNQIYVGVASLVDEETGSIGSTTGALRSAVCSTITAGPAKYEAPAGTVTGEITLKRQYRIEQGKLVYMFDSDLTINDDVLQMTLSKTADNRMKHIVYTIQREQNQAIREANRVLFVQGPAGCGKTSIALHRAAYLLYRYRECWMPAK